MKPTAGRRPSIFSRRHAYSLWSIVSAIMLTAWLPAFAQQSQPYHLISAATDNATSVKGTSGQLVTVVAINTTATLYYLKFYDTAAVPACDTTAVALTIPVPFGTSSSGGGVVISPQEAARFLSGIGICLVAGIADNDDTSAATGVAIDIFFK